MQIQHRDADGEKTPLPQPPRTAILRPNTPFVCGVRRPVGQHHFDADGPRNEHTARAIVLGRHPVQLTRWRFVLVGARKDPLVDFAMSLALLSQRFTPLVRQRNGRHADGYGPSTSRRAGSRSRFLVRSILVWLVVAAGCASNEFVSLRRVPRNPLAGSLQLFSFWGPQATDRTDQLVRRYDLSRDGEAEVLSHLSEEIARDPQPEKLYAYAELAYVKASKAAAMHRKTEALDYYAAAVAHAYWYLFDDQFDYARNPYDPQFRGACNLYNSSLENAMRIVNESQPLKPGSVYTIEAGSGQFQVAVTSNGPWHDEDFERLEFVSDYEIEGLSNRHQTHGMGVPLIAIRRQHAAGGHGESYYPEGLSFAVTAFLRVQPVMNGSRGSIRCTLELHDPVSAKDISVAGRRVPLETDLSTPLAYFLGNPELREKKSIATVALLKPERVIEGVYMLEPYDPQRIPVLLVHGLWSSPLTWMEMFNDLRSFPEIRDQYQFWFYLYPTGQPFWVSAAKLREDLSEMLTTLDPQRQSPTLGQMVLIGHSMGGLIARLQTFDSGDDYWRILTDRPFEELQADATTRERLARTVFFAPNPAIRRVVTIGTPHRGSEFANRYTRWLGRNLITLPEMMVRAGESLRRDNPDFFRDTELLSIKTSIDSLAPDSPILPVMVRSRRAPWTKYHNIVGVVPNDGIVRRISGEGDGIVSRESAEIDDVDSELTVPADHLTVHRHPQSILEVRRILLNHRDVALAEMQHFQSAQPAAYQQ